MLLSVPVLLYMSVGMHMSMRVLFLGFMFLFLLLRVLFRGFCRVYRNFFDWLQLFFRIDAGEFFDLNAHLLCVILVIRELRNMLIGHIGILLIHGCCIAAKEVISLIFV